MNVTSSVSAANSSRTTTTASTQTEGSAREASASATENRGDRRSSARLEQQAKQFRELMSGGQTTASQLAEVAGRGGEAMPLEERTMHGGKHHWAGLKDELLDQSADAASMLAVEQRVDRGVVAQPAAVHGSPDMTFAELVEKHVRRALASRETSSSSGGEIRLELSDAVLPGLSVSLKRTAAGWHLSAASDNRDSLDKLSQFAPALVERFAQASLGDLIVSLDGA